MDMNGHDSDFLRYWKSLTTFVKISEEAQKNKNEKKKLEEIPPNEPNLSEKAEISPEQQIQLPARVPLFKTIVPLEKVEKTVKNMEFMQKEQLVEALQPFPNANLTKMELNASDSEIRCQRQANIVGPVENPPTPEKPKEKRNYYAEMCNIGEDVELTEFLIKWKKEEDLEDNEDEGEDGEDQDDIELQKKNMEWREELQMAQKEDFAKMSQKTGYSFMNPPSLSKSSKIPNSNKKGNRLMKYHQEMYNIDPVDVELEKLMEKWKKEEDLEKLEEQLKDIAPLVENPPNPETQKAETPSSSPFKPPKEPEKVSPVNKFYDEKNGYRDKELEEFMAKISEENWDDLKTTSSEDPWKIGGPMEYPPNSSSSKKPSEKKKYYAKKHNIRKNNQFDELLAKMEEENFEFQKKNIELREELQMAQSDDFAKKCQKNEFEIFMAIMNNATSSEKKEEQQEVPGSSGKRHYEFTKDDLYGYD